MSIESELYTRVKEDADVKAVIKGEMHPVLVSYTATMPYLAYARNSTEPQKVMSGDAGVRMANFRITCWSRDYFATVDLAEKVVASIDNFGPGNWGSVEVQRCFVVNESDELEPSPELGEQRAFGRNIDIEIVYTV